MNKLNKIVDSVSVAQMRGFRRVSDSVKSTSSKAQKLAEIIEGQIRDHFDTEEDMISELKDYKKQYRSEPDYNFAQHGNLAISEYSDAVKALEDAGYKNPSPYNAWGTVLRTTRIVIDKLLSEASKVSDSAEEDDKMYNAEVKFYSRDWDKVLEHFKKHSPWTFTPVHPYTLIFNAEGNPHLVDDVVKMAKELGVEIVEANDITDIDDSCKIHDSFAADEEVSFKDLLDEVGYEQVFDELEQWLPASENKEFTSDYKRYHDIEDDEVVVMRDLLEQGVSESYADVSDVIEEFTAWAPSDMQDEFVKDFIRLYDLREDEEVEDDK